MKSSLLRLLTAHPRSVGETYGGHLRGACRIAWRLLTAAVSCFVHALLPFLLQRAASDCVIELHDRLIVRRAPRTTNDDNV